MRAEPKTLAGGPVAQPEATPATADDPYRQVFDLSPQPMWICDGESMALLAVNPATVARYGYSRDELLAMTVHDLHPADELPRLIQHLERHQAAAVSTRTSRHRAKDGTTFDVQITAFAIRHGARPALLVLVQDLTAGRRAEARARRWERVFAEAQFGLAHADLRTGTFVEVNPTFARERGYLPAELVGRPTTDLYPPALRSAASQRLENLSQSHHAVFETVHLRKEGSTFPVLMEVTTIADDSGEPASLVAYALDISERQRASEILKAKEYLLSESQRIAHIGSWSLNLVDDGCTWSAENFRVLGFAPGTIEPSKAAFLERIHRDDLARLEAHLRSCLAGNEVAGVEFRIVVDGGEVRHICSFAEMLRDADGQPTQLLGTAQDITARVQTEQALRDSEAALLAAQRVANVGSWTWDLQTGRIASSEQLLRIFGRDASYKEMGSPDLAQFHPDDREKIAAAQQLMLTTGATPPIESRVVWPDGSVRQVRSEAGELVRDDLGRPLRLSGIVQDITERKAAEAALQRSEELYRHLFERHAAVKLLLDPATGAIIDANQAASEFYGWPRERMRQMNIADINTMPQEAVRAALDKVLHEQRVQFEFKHRRADGSERDVAVFASPIEADGRRILHAIVHDITDRRLVEAERARLAAAVEQAGEAIVITDRDATISYVNPAFDRMTGYSREQALGRQPQILDRSQQNAALYQQIGATITAGATWRGRLVTVRQDGSPLTVDAAISPVLVEDKVANFVAVCRDITAQLQQDEHLRQAQRLDAVGVLAGGVAHDFNNMLGVILGNVELALTQQPPPALRKRLGEIQEAAERSALLTRQLLGFARKQPVARRRLDLNETIESLLKMLRRIIGENIDLQWLPAPALAPVSMDPAQVDQVLANLCINARDAISGAGRLTIETSNVTLSPLDCETHADWKPGAYVRVTVRDTGCGMSPETLARAFEPFFTTKAFGQGTGLGLATAYGIVQQNAGFITVESAVGCGSTFQIFLPQLGAPTVAPESTATTTIAAPARGETILIVEDEPALLTVATMLLESDGYVVLPLPSPAAALAAASAYDGEIDLLITDVVMPGMDGVELARQLRESRPRLRCLFMSGYSASLLAKLDPQTAPAFISKPFTSGQLREALRLLLERRPPSPST